MPIHPREQSALTALQHLDLDQRLVLRMYRMLFKVYDKQTELIQAENYRVLADVCLEELEKKGGGAKEAGESEGGRLSSRIRTSGQQEERRKVQPGEQNVAGGPSTDGTVPLVKVQLMVAPQSAAVVKHETDVGTGAAAHVVEKRRILSPRPGLALKKPKLEPPTAEHSFASSTLLPATTHHGSERQALGPMPLASRPPVDIERRFQAASSFSSVPTVSFHPQPQAQDRWTGQVKQQLAEPYHVWRERESVRLACPPPRFSKGHVETARESSNAAAAALQSPFQSAVERNAASCLPLQTSAQVQGLKRHRKSETHNDCQQHPTPALSTDAAVTLADADGNAHVEDHDSELDPAMLRKHMRKSMPPSKDPEPSVPRKKREQSVFREEQQMAPTQNRGVLVVAVADEYDQLAKPQVQPGSSGSERPNPLALVLVPPSLQAHGADVQRGSRPLEGDKKGKSLMVVKNWDSPQSEAVVSKGNHVADAKHSGFQHSKADISRGFERVPISWVNDFTSEVLPPCFQYIRQNVVFQSTNLVFPLARVEDENCCSCSQDCLKNKIPCGCSARSGGIYAYTKDGCLTDQLIEQYKKKCDEGPVFVKCLTAECPLEKGRQCRGHPQRPFIKECWLKCRCGKECGNRVVQRGITRRLQVFMTPEGKGWGLRTLEDLPKGAFVCEYVGEILTNTELDERNKKNKDTTHHYPMYLDGDWGSEQFLTDNDALCLDGTKFGNVARFINHRCGDSNMMEMAVEIECPDHHYYHVAFFTTRIVKAYDELTWDYQMDFDDVTHPIEAFFCVCGSPRCRGSKTRAETRCVKT